MAEFCLYCWNRLHKTNYTRKNCIISKELTICEGCGELKHVVIGKKRRYNIPEGMHAYISVVLISELFYLIIKILTLPFLLVSSCIEKHRK